MAISAHYLALCQFCLQPRPRSPRTAKPADVCSLLSSHVIEIHNERRKVATTVSTRPALHLVNVVVDGLTSTPVAWCDSRHLKFTISLIPFALILTLIFSTAVEVFPGHFGSETGIFLSPKRAAGSGASGGQPRAKRVAVSQIQRSARNL